MVFIRFIPYIILLIIFIKFKRLNIYDNFYIANELILIFILITIINIVVPINMIYQTLTKPSVLANSILLPLIATNTNYLCEFIVVLISTKWVLNKLKLINKKNHKTQISATDYEQHTLKNTLTHQIKFNLFMKHLNKELSIEGLLNDSLIFSFSPFSHWV